MLTLGSSAAKNQEQETHCAKAVHAYTQVPGSLMKGKRDKGNGVKKQRRQKDKKKKT